MVQIWVIIGEANTRKSATIRALTGVGRAQINWQVDYTLGGSCPTFAWVQSLILLFIGFAARGSFPTFVWVQSPQEQKPPLMPKDVIQIVQNAQADRVILPLRYSPVKNTPGADAYLNSFATTGWKIECLTYLGNHPVFVHPAGFAIPFQHIPGTRGMSSNNIASQIRGKWGLL